MRRPAWVEVDLGAIRHNAEALAALAGTRLLAVVKADAYGHGAVAVAEALAGLPPVYGFGVATPDEALELRQAGVAKPVLVLGPAPDCVPELAAADVAVTVGSLEEARRAAEQTTDGVRTPLAVHIELETGMGRTGARPELLSRIVQELAAAPRLQLAGVYSHFAVAETDLDFTRRQLAAFQAAVEPFRRDSLPQHLANSAGLIRLPEARLDLCRPGAALYGFNPGLPAGEMPRLRPALSLTAQVVALREIRPGETSGYGRRFCAARLTTVAVVPVGYADGYCRGLSGTGDVLVRGARCPVVGSVSMDTLVVDVTGVAAVRLGDEVVLLGPQGDEAITVEELAGRAGRIPHEITTCLGRRLPRLYREPTA